MFMTCVRYIKSCKIYLTSRVGFADLPDLCLWKEEKWYSDLESCLVWIYCDYKLPVHKNKPSEPLQFHIFYGWQ